MRLLILGGGGAIGSAVARHAAARGIDTCAVLSATTAESRLAGFPAIAIERCDIRDASELAGVLRRRTPDLVVMAAFPKTRPDDHDCRRALLLEMCGGICGLSEALSRTRFTGRLVLVGSALSYGSAGWPRRADSALRPETFRGAVKAAESIIAAQLANESGIPLTELRVFTAYGPFEQRERLIPQLLRAALTGGRVALTAAPTERDFIHYDDVSRACLAAAVSSHRSAAAFNICTGVLTTNRAVAQALERITGRPLIASEPYDRSDAYGVVAPGALPRPEEGLDWSPELDIEAGLERCWAWASSDEGSAYLLGRSAE